MLVHQWYNEQGTGNDLGFGDATTALLELGKEFFLKKFNYTWKLW